jgi:hypothetical protein
VTHQLVICQRVTTISTGGIVEKFEVSYVPEMTAQGVLCASLCLHQETVLAALMAFASVQQELGLAALMAFALGATQTAKCHCGHMR